MLLNYINKFSENYCTAFFLINVTIFFSLLVSYIVYKNKKKHWDKLSDYIGNMTKTVDSVRYGDLTRKIDSLDIPDSENLTQSFNRMIESLHDRESMITEYQNELSKQNKLLESIINSLSDGLLIIDSNNKILRVTSNVAKWFKNEGKKIVGSNIEDYIQVQRKKPIELLKNDEVNVIPEKSLKFTASTIELKHDDKKHMHVVILKNVTEQVELETLREDFVATLTHDLKVPIIAESNMIDLFLAQRFGEISPKQKLALENMQASSKELLDLVQVVLDTYKIKDGKITLYKENILLKGFIEEIIEEMNPIASKTYNTLDFILERDIRVFADRFQLKRVIKNLIQNAISYGKQKTPIKITIGEIPDYITIKIKDQGNGIAKEDIDKIFDRYYSAAKKFRKIGTGLGLYLAQLVTQAHNGDLKVESVEGEYTEFCIMLPAQDYERRFM